MKRVPEPELMEDEAQAMAYAQADFSEPNKNFVENFLAKTSNKNTFATVLDLGCGPGDIVFSLAEHFREATFTAVDGAEAMMAAGRHKLERLTDLQGRVNFVCGRVPDIDLANAPFDVISSNSLLHHLPDGSLMWKSIQKYAAQGSFVMVMDLLRPASISEAEDLVEQYASEEPEILQRDFFNSLCAAFSIDEVRSQLAAAGLDHFTAEAVSDRHLLIDGEL